MDTTELENRKTNFELKAKNLKNATDSVLIDEFSSIWLMQNYLSSLEEAQAEAKKLLSCMKTLEV